ncbi:MAG: hypothetical protein DRI90_17730 [Deltaproteobacteria bacterium]|nr:MAG: hypothetical protein DRI90_17730 [Deltaproteobacteria bacterium]
MPSPEAATPSGAATGGRAADRRRNASVLTADPGAARRRRLAADVLAGGFVVRTAPDLDSACTMLRTSQVSAVFCSVELLGSSAGLDQLMAADPRVQLLLGAAPHEVELVAALALGRPCVPVPLPVENLPWLHLHLDGAIARRQALDQLAGAQGRELDRALTALAELPYRDAKAQLIERFDERYVGTLLSQGDRAAAQLRTALSASSFRQLCDRVDKHRKARKPGK